ncbi:unnamed protein product [Cylicocyclus nassatus]|uniref:Uncharacterized protein n=1 Tax=Cylicocyclus nassatus TaxID=53992 RepID=A0AA36H9M3_CYLNA|nr:unnamed protein product [Cylicocyclus nassatus]
MFNTSTPGGLATASRESVDCRSLAMGQWGDYRGFFLPTLVRHSVNRRGNNMNQAHYDCLQLLSEHKSWEYVLLLQNYDMMIKTVYETVSILKEFGGANDICARPCERERWNHSAKWDVRSLKLFRNESQATDAQRTTNLTIVRGFVQCSLSRAAVDWAVKIVDLTPLINQLNINEYAIDETLWSVLQMNDDLQMPGSFTAKCLNNETYVPCITRSAWMGFFKIGLCQCKLT